jgi:hypothetical protein
MEPVSAVPIEIENPQNRAVPIGEFDIESPQNVIPPAVLSNKLNRILKILKMEFHLLHLLLEIKLLLKVNWHVVASVFKELRSKNNQYN